jgi:hypothetical protein
VILGWLENRAVIEGEKKERPYWSVLNLLLEIKGIPMVCTGG